MTERSPSSVHGLDQARVPAAPREPRRHLLTLIVVAVALFVLCEVVFHALERLL